MSVKNPSPLLLDVRDLTRRPGEVRERSITTDVPSRMGEGLVSVGEGENLHFEAKLESLHEGILVSGDVTTRATGVCGRCLRAIELPVEVDIQELFAYSSDEACEYEVHDNHVDCDPLIRDAVVLSLPFQPVCRPDCPGLDPETGERLTERPHGDGEAPLDPRWSALADLLASDDDSSGH